MKRRGIGMLAALVVSVVAGSAVAQEGLHPARLDPTWKGLAFGSSRDQVLEVLKRRIQDRYGAMIRDTLDVRDRDRLTREMQKEIDEVQGSRVVFDGTQTGWNVSILRDEFVSGRGIEMVIVREGNARTYLFFVDGGLYKMIVTPRNPLREPAMASLKAVYGEPAKTAWIDTRQTRLDHADWAQPPLTLVLHDRTRQFQTVMLRWALQDKDDPIQAEVRKNEAGGPALNPLIKEAQEATSEEGKDPVDDLIGQPPAKKPAGKPKPRRK